MKTNLINNRQIRVFISSTFRDMQDERDYLMKRTFPKLRMLAAERDVTLTELDLRWGITEEESKSGKVVEICLNEIDNSIPFFIGIIGNRYGWIPNKEDVCESSSMADRYNWVYKDIESRLSVTEMEMQYGVLRRKEDTNAYFYIKESTTDDDNIDYPEKLQQFKQSVKDNGRYSVSSYETVEQLAANVERDFCQLLDSIFPLSSNNPLERAQKVQGACIRQLCQCYVPSTTYFTALNNFVEGSQFDYITITGENGIGKSALLANWLNSKRDDTRNYWLSYFTNGQSELSPEYVLSYWIHELQVLQGKNISPLKDDATLEALKEQLEGEISSCDRSVIIVLDDVTIFQKSDNWQLNTLSWIPTMRSGNKMIISSSVAKKCLTEFFLSESGCTETSLELQHIDKGAIEKVVHDYLRLYGKSLTDQQVSRISAFKFMSNPRMLMTLLNELVTYGNYETLDKFLESFLGAWTANNFYERYLNHVEQYFEKGQVEKVLMLITLSQYGLTEAEARAFTGLKHMAWSQIYCTFAKYFSINNGRLSIVSADIYAAITHKYEKNASEHRNRLIASLENALTQTEAPKEKEKLWDELSSQYFAQASNYAFEEEMADKLYALISEPDVMWYFITKRASKMVSINGEAKQAYKYWSWLYEYNSEKYSMTTYLVEGKFEDSDFLYKSPDFVDVALHAGDNDAAALLGMKAISLFRKGIPMDEKEQEYFKYNIDILHIAARRWNMQKLSENLQQLSNEYAKSKTLPAETDGEKCLKTYIEGRISTNPVLRIERFRKALSYLESFEGETYSDMAIVNYRMSNAYSDMEQYDEAFKRIEEAIKCMNLIEGEYDDYNECFKAHLSGVKGKILKDMGKYAEAYDTILNDTIIKYEDIEDTRLLHDDMRSTIDYIEAWEPLLYELQDLLEEGNE